MIKRIYTEKLKKLLDQFPAVGVLGARQVGKTFLVKNLLDEKRIFYNLDDLTTLSLLQNTPSIISATEENVTIDEIQRLPQLLLEIKKSVDQDYKEGKFLLTGSANINFLPKIQETLAGRIAFIEMMPLTFYEIYSNRQRPAFVNMLENNDISVLESNKCAKLNVIDEIFYGFYPRLQINKSLDFSFSWFENYLKTYIERDVRQIRNIKDLASFQKSLRLLNARIGNKLNIRHLSKEADISYSTLSQFINILTISYQFFFLPPYYVNIDKRLVKHPKIYNTDAGFAAYLMDLTNAQKAESFGKLGALVENKVIADLKALLSVFKPNARLYFFSVHEGIEIDLVIEYNGKLLPIEIKSSSVVKNNHLRGIKRFIQIFENRTDFGIVAYLGDNFMQIDNKLYLVPITNLLC